MEGLSCNKNYPPGPKRGYSKLQLIVSSFNLQIIIRKQRLQNLIPFAVSLTFNQATKTTS